MGAVTCDVVVPQALTTSGDATLSGEVTVAVLAADLIGEQSVEVVCSEPQGTVELGSIALVAQPA